MNVTRTAQVAFAALLVLVIFIATPIRAGHVKSLDDAKKIAAEHERPILIKIGTDWCGDCKDFDSAVENEAALREAIHENVVLFKVDAQKEDGKQIAKAYHVKNFPTFVLTDSRGETIDQWYGFACQDCFVKRLTGSVSDPITVNERIERFRDEPTEDDAKKIADIRHAQGSFAEAAAYYRRAQELNPEANYETHIFNSMAYGNYYQLFSADQVKKQADVVLASTGRSDKDLIKVALSMYKIAMRNDDMALGIPYLKAGVEQTANSDDEGVLKKRAKLLPEYALHVEKNEKKAIALKKAAMPEGWLEDANMLNLFAWWCFENKINLEEADTMARRGIELAQAGRQKANILDTLAEICNLSGDCGEAVDYIKLAIAEDPENEYFQNQLVRFEENLAAQR